MKTCSYNNIFVELLNILNSLKIDPKVKWQKNDENPIIFTMDGRWIYFYHHDNCLRLICGAIVATAKRKDISHLVTQSTALTIHSLVSAVRAEKARDSNHTAILFYETIVWFNLSL